MSEEINIPNEGEETSIPTIDDLNGVLDYLKGNISHIDYPENYTDYVKDKLKNDFFNITVKISNHPKFSDVERYISVTSVEISFGNQTVDKRFIKMSYNIVFVKNGEDVTDEFSQYNPPIVGDMYKMMLPRMMDGTPVIETVSQDAYFPPTYDVDGVQLTEGYYGTIENVVRYPMFEVMMPMFNAPISDRDIIIAFVNENDVDGFFNR